MDNVHVAIRVRPLITRESNHDLALYWKVDNSSIFQIDAKNKAVGKPYTFDYVFHMGQSTNDVYSQVAQPIIESAMDGYDGTIFAYGQTSSGKTFTMQGHTKEPGIIPKAIQQIFDTIDKSTDREYLLRVCYMELYNEVITDLLCKDGKGLNIREQEKRVFVSGLTEEVVNNADKIMQLLKKGDQQRHVGQTNMNEHSSRSHTVFCIVIESRERSNKRQSYNGAVKVSRLNLVDLAGSERLNDTKAEGMRLKEACNINQSLFVLGQVINKLSSGAEYIPFRDSKLTRILQPSLGGNAKTAIICTVTPAAIEQTHSTLQFASRAKTIKNKPEMHEILSDEALLRRYKSEIQNLKKQIDQFDKKDKHDDDWKSLENQKKQMAEENQRLIEQRTRLENMVISGQGGSGQKTKKRPNRRETWCFGTRKSPLLPSDPIASAAAVAAEVGAFDIVNFKIPQQVTSSSSSISVSSDEFSESKLDVFTEECAASYSSDEAVPKKKRRRAVHFSEIPAFMEDGAVFGHEIGCQTEDMNTEDVSSEQLQESIIICEAVMQEKDQLQNENELMHQQITQLKDENQQVNSAYITLEMESDQVKLELKKVREEFIELREFTSIEQEVNDAHYKDMEVKHQSAIKELNEMIDGKENEIERLRRSTSIPSSTQVSDSDQTEKELFAEKVKHLEKSIEDAETVVMDTNRALSEMKDMNVELEKEMESLKKSLQQLENEKSDFQASLEIQKEKSDHMCADLRTELQMTYRQLAEAKGEEVNDMPENAPPSLKELQETIERLTKESESVKEDLLLSITSSVEIQEDLINCQAELEERSNTCKTLESEVATLQNELESASTMADERGVQQDEEDLPDSQDARNQENEALNIQVLALQEELQQSRMAADEILKEQGRDSELEKMLDARTHECEVLIQKITSLEEELVEAKAAKAEIPIDQNESCELKDTKLQECENDSMSLQEEESIVTEEIDVIDQDGISVIKAKLDAKLKECEVLNHKITSLQEELAARAETSIELNSKTMSLHYELEAALKGKTPIDECEITDIQVELNVKTQEIETLNAKIILLHEELEHAEKVEEITEDQTVLKMQEVLDSREQECQTLRVNVVSLQEEVERLKNASDGMLQEQGLSNLQEDLVASTQETDTKVMSLQEELEQAAVVAEETLNDKSDACDLEMCLNAKTEEFETLNGMVNSLLEQLEKPKMSTTENDLVLDLEQRLQLSKDYEVELESEIELLKEQLMLFNGQGNADINLKEELMDAIVGSDQSISDMASDMATEDTLNQIETSQREDVSLDKTDNAPLTNEEVEVPSDDENVKEQVVYLEAKVTELQGQLAQMSELLTEMSDKVDHSEEMLKFSKDYEVELERQLEEASKSMEVVDSDAKALQEQVEKLNAEKTGLQTTMTDTESKLADTESKLSGSEASFAALESKLSGSEASVAALESKLKDTETKGTDMESSLTETEAKFADMECKIADLTSKLADSEVKVEQWKGEVDMSKRLMTEQSMSTDMMSTKLETYRQTADRAKGVLLAENNRELEQQRRIETLESAQKESVSVFQQASKEKDEVIAGLEKKSRDLLTKLRQAEAESDQATHRSLQMDRESQDLRGRVRELENHAFENSQLSWKQEMDPAKLAQRMKQLEFNLDITKQKSEKFEKLNKELKDSNKKYEANEFKASDLEKQLRDVNFEYERHRTQFNQMKSRYDNIVVELAEVKHRLTKSELKNAGVDTDKMKDDLCTLEKENHKLKENVGLSDQKLLQLANAIAVDEKKHEQAQENMKAVQDEVQYCNATIRELELEREDMRSKMEKNKKHLKNMCQELEDELTTCKTLLADCQEQLHNDKLKNDKYVVKLKEMEEAAEQEKSKACRECEALNNEKNQHLEQFKQLETEKEELASNIQQETERLNSIVNEKDSELERLNNELSQHVEKHQKLMEDGMKYMTEMETVKEEKEVANERLKKQVMEAEQKMENIQQELEDQSASHQQEIDILKEDAMKYMTKMEKLKEEKEVENDRFKEQVMEAEQKMENIQQELADQSIRHQEQTTTLQEDAMKCMTQMEKLKEEKELANERLKEKEMEAEQKIENIQQKLEDQSIKHQQEMNTLQEDAMKYMTETLKEEKEVANEKLKEQVMEAEQKIENIQQELEDQSVRHQQEMNTLQADTLKYMTKMEILKQEKEVANERLQGKEMEAKQKIENIQQNLTDQSIRHQQEMNTLQSTLDELRIELASVRATGEAAEQDDWALGKVCNDLERELEEERQQNIQNNEALKEEQDKCSSLKLKHDSLVTQLKVLKRQDRELEQLCDQIQEEHEEEERKHKETKLQLNKLETKFSEVKSNFVEVNETCDKIKKEKKEEEKEHKNTRAKVAELEANIKKNKNLADENTLKVLQQDLLEKKMKIVSLESEILKSTDPLEKRISQLTKELSDSSEKVESWKKEAKRLRKQSLDTKADNSTSLRSEAGSGHGIIQECAVFTLKAENAKIEQELKRSKNKIHDLEKKYNEKSMFYQEEVTRNNRLRAELKRYMEKLKKFEKVKEQMHKIPDVTQKRPLNDIPTNSPVKKASKIHTTVESLPTSTKPASTMKKAKTNDWDNFLQPAIEQLNDEEKPQQCAQQ